MPFLKRKQESAAKFAPSFAPKGALGLTFRNQVTRLFQMPSLAEFFIGRDLRQDVQLPDYGSQRMSCVASSAGRHIFLKVLHYSIFEDLSSG